MRLELSLALMVLQSTGKEIRAFWQQSMAPWRFLCGKKSRTEPASKLLSSQRCLAICLQQQAHFPQVGLPGITEKRLESLLLHATSHVVISTLHPRSLISIVFQVISDDGSVIGFPFQFLCSLLRTAVVLRHQCYVSGSSGRRNFIEHVCSRDDNLNRHFRQEPVSGSN